MTKLNEKERKRKVIKETTQLGIAISVVIIYFFSYIGSLTTSENINVITAFSYLGERITHFRLFFPINAGAVFFMFLAIIASVLVVIFMRLHAKNHYTYDRDAIAGTGGFMGKEDLAAYHKKYVDLSPYIDPGTEEQNPLANRNMILSYDILRNMNDRKTRRNNNVLVVGGAGSGKTRFFIKPNLLQLNCCPIVTDPSGELIDSVGKLYQENGYKIKIFNLSNMRHSSCYNALHYIRDEAGVLMVIECLIKNTTGKGQKGDEFFENAERLVYAACIFYLLDYEKDESRKNMAGVLDLINMSSVDENDASKKSPLDHLFEQIPYDSLASRYYRSFKQAAGRTLKSILISCVTRLQPFMIPQVRFLTKRDDLELERIGREKIALFIITPQADLTFSFLASMLYSQLFETLYHVGEHKKLDDGDERLLYPVRCLMDEFSNIGEIPYFPEKLSTMRKYNISATIILQDISQIQAMYKDAWRTIMANCDNTVFLGNSEPETLKYFSEKLGNETITAMSSRGRSYGRTGSFSATTTQTKREVMTAEEIGRLGDEECIVFLRGIRPYFGRKYEYTDHKNYVLTGDCDKERRFAYDKNPFYDNQLLSGYDSILQAKADIQLEEEEISVAKTADFLSDAGEIHELLDNLILDEDSETMRYFSFLNASQKEMENARDKEYPLLFASVKNLPPKYMKDIMYHIANPEEKAILISETKEDVIMGICTSIAEDSVSAYSFCEIEDREFDFITFSLPTNQLDLFRQQLLH